MWDERFSSEGAFNLASNLDVNTSKKIKKLDENAAAFILQGVLDFLKKQLDIITQKAYRVDFNGSY